MIGRSVKGNSPIFVDTKIGTVPCIVAIIGLMFLPGTASAHQVHVFARVHDTTIHGEAHYADETPIKNADVRALDPAGNELGRTKTNEQGKFILQAKFRCDHRLVVDTGDGHGAHHTVVAAELPGDLPPLGDVPHSIAEAPDEPLPRATIEALDRQLAALRGELDRQHAALQREFDRYKQRIWLRDLLGGIGWIFGAAGMAFYGYAMYVLKVKCKQSKSNQ